MLSFEINFGASIYAHFIGYGKKHRKKSVRDGASASRRLTIRG